MTRASLVSLLAVLTWALTARLQFFGLTPQHVQDLKCRDAAYLITEQWPNHAVDFVLYTLQKSTSSTTSKKWSILFYPLDQAITFGHDSQKTHRDWPHYNAFTSSFALPTGTLNKSHLGLPRIHPVQENGAKAQSRSVSRFVYACS